MSELPNPAPTKFIDPSHDRYSTLPFYDERYFQDVYEIFTFDPIKPEDKVMIGMPRYLGIEKGKPFNPTEMQKKAMRQGMIDAYF